MNGVEKKYKNINKGQKRYWTFIFYHLLGIITSMYAQHIEKPINPNGYNKFYYETGVLASEGMMRDGKPDGYWKTYNPNGTLKSEGNRKDYELDSLWKFYNSEGKLITEIYYQKGKKHGTKTTWSEEGYILSEESFASDIKQGFSFWYYPPDTTTPSPHSLKGPLKMKIYYEKGKEHGIAYEYDPKGTIITLMEYNMGVLKKRETINRTDAKGQKQGIWKEFYPDGKIKSEIMYYNNKKTGYAKTYSPEGSLLSIEKYVGDSLQKEAPELTTKLEVRNEYYPDGTLKKTGTYLHGVPEGIHKEFSEDGKIVWAKIYSQGTVIAEGKMNEQGNPEGVWTEYHPGGQLKGKGAYINGTRTGEWFFYHTNGKIEQKGKYDKQGRPQGVWQWFYENGNLLREETYLNGKREGMFIEWNDTGKIITKGEYLDGLREGHWIYEINDYREEGKYKNGQKDGLWKSYYLHNGQLQFEGSFIEGIPDGKHVFYYSDGKIKEEGKYIAGNKEGNWTYYNPDGTVLLVITFKKGREVKFDGAIVRPLLPGETVK